MNRDDFPPRVKDALAKRVNMRCSNPQCRRGTSGPQEDPARVINVGVASHITAAAPGGPRYDATLTPEQRRSIENGIWLCQVCGKMVDDDVRRFTAVELRAWKSKAEDCARREITATPGQATLLVRVSSTRDRRRQLAQFSLFNASSEPIYIASWNVGWGPPDTPRYVASIECFAGTLPRRILPHDAFDFIVSLDGIEVESINHLGVEGAMGERWQVDRIQLQAFTNTAIANRPPSPEPQGPGDAALRSCEVAIEAHDTSTPDGRPSLSLLFRNRGPHSIRLRGAELKWCYNPPRRLSPTGKVQVLETDHTIRLPAGLPLPVVTAGSEHWFRLDPQAVELLTGALSDDVAESDISVEVLAGERLRWVEKEGVGAVVRRVARLAIANWD